MICSPHCHDLYGSCPPWFRRRYPLVLGDTMLIGDFLLTLVEVEVADEAPPTPPLAAGGAGGAAGDGEGPHGCADLIQGLRMLCQPEKPYCLM